MSSTRPGTAGSTSSLMQDLPGSFVADGEPSFENTEGEPTYQTLSAAVHARRAEYVRQKQIRIKVGTWNVASQSGAADDIGRWFVTADDVANQLASLNMNETQSYHAKQSNHTSAPTVPEHSAHPQVHQASNNAQTDHLISSNAVDMYVLGLQEVVDINSATEALKPYTDPSVAKKWKDALSANLPQSFVLVVEQQLLGLLLFVYASPSIVDDVHFVSSKSVGTGLIGYMANKGATASRLLIGESTKLLFVNSHLAAGSDKAALERRNWDVQQIIQRIKFDPIPEGFNFQHVQGTRMGDEDFAFWFGDLNYRLEGIPGDDVRRLLTIHTKKLFSLDNSDFLRNHQQSAEGDGNLQNANAREPDPNRDLDEEFLDPHNDPASLQATLSSLLPHDELRQQMATRHAFHDGWREGSIEFLPTFKYDLGSIGTFDTSEKRRGPSWCDRILFRDRKDKVKFESVMRDEAVARKLDEEMKARGTDQAAHEEEILYDYDPDNDGVNAIDEYDEQDENGGSGMEANLEHDVPTDLLRIEQYTTHQRIVTSDHKPVVAIFSLHYDVAVPELKAIVQADVAKELDRAENEGRPSVTVVVDNLEDEVAQIHSSQHGSHLTDSNEVLFNEIKWAQTKRRGMTIANTGRVKATFGFLERLGPFLGSSNSGWWQLEIDGRPHKDWNITTTNVTLEPGDSVYVEIRAQIVEMSVVQALNRSCQALDDVLVLRIESGRDHFIPVKATWMQTCLTLSIDELIRIPEGGIRQKNHHLRASDQDAPMADTASHAESSSPATDPGPVRFSAPRELFRLTEAIEKVGTRVIAEIDMTNSQSSDTIPWVGSAAWPFDEECWPEHLTERWQDGLSSICNALDTDTALDGNLSSEYSQLQRLYLLADLLLIFLSSMPDGIIDENLWSAINSYFADPIHTKRQTSIDEQRTAIQEILSSSPSHNISFILVTSMLGHLRNDIAEVEKVRPKTPHSPPSPSSPSSKKSPLMRMRTFGRLSSEQRANRATEMLSKVFADVMVRASSRPEDAKRKVELLRLFIEEG